VTHKLLLADDSVTIQRVVELTFSGEDVQVVTVGDGEQAIARIPIELPDVVLADIGMPKRSGYDVAAFVKGRPDLAHIPVLLLAGAFEPVDEARAQQVHCDGVLVKPFEPQQVISRVRDLIERSRVTTPAPPSPAAEPAQPPSPQLAPPKVEPAVESIEPPRRPEPVLTSQAPARAEPQLDDYFGRLDAAFARLGEEPERHAPRFTTSDDHDTRDVPTIESVIGTPAPHEYRRAGETSGARERSRYHAMDEPGAEGASLGGAEALPSGGRNLVADMFAALFAIEQGDGAPHVQPAPSRPAGQSSQISDELVDEVTRRVIERLAPETATELVAQIVSEVAERLVREEISRIKSAVATRV
jgi:CheY-like chemotaxis protein